MSRSASFGLGLLFLLTALVAAAWGAHQLGLTEESRVSFARAEAPAHAEPVCAYVPGRLYSPPNAAEIADARASFAALPVCYAVPGQMFAAPNAAQVAEARVGWAWASVCYFDPSRGFGAAPSAAALAQTRGLLWGFNPWAAGLASLVAAAGTMSLGHGLLVGSLSIFNPAFIAVGWWLLLPEIALAQAGWIGAAGLGTAALTLLAPRYVRRRTAIEAMRRTPRGWLTPKRVALVGGGWMMTVGVLAAVYPSVTKLIPQMPGVTAASRSMPKTGRGPSPVADTVPAATDPATQTALADPVPASAMPPLLQAAGGDASQGQTPQQSAQPPAAPMPRITPFSPALASLSGGNGNGGGGQSAASADDLAAASGSGSGTVTTPAVPATTSLNALANYLPPSTPAATSGPAPATPSAAADPAPVPATPAPVEIAANDDGRSAIADSPIITPEAPLPSGNDAVLPVNSPTPGGGQPSQPGSPPATLAPANPGALDGNTTPVPEPGMIGLFGLAVLALARRRAK